MEEYDFKNMELNDDDKRFFEEIKKLIGANNIGESLKCINHVINGYLHKALLALENLQNGILDTEEKRKEAFTKVTQNSLKASLAAKELRKFYHL